MVFVQPNKFLKFLLSRTKKISKLRTTKLNYRILISAKDKIINNKFRGLILEENDINKEISINKFNWSIFFFLLTS